MKKVVYIAPCFKSSGYGVAATMNLRSMLTQKEHLDVRWLPTDPAITFDQDTYGPLMWGGLQDFVPDVFLIHAVPTMLCPVARELPPNIPKVAYTTWESYGGPEELVDEVYQGFDKIFFPSQFSLYGFFGELNSKLRVVPHAFDPEFWLEDRPRRPPNRTFQFVSTLTWNERKNPVGLIQAFYHAFADRPNDAVLTIVTPSYSKEDMQFLLSSANLSHVPIVRMVGVLDEEGRLTDREYRNLIWNSDCYVTAARSEGWGLGAFEAWLSGVPVLGGNTGMAEFLPMESRLSAGTRSPVCYPPELSNTELVGGVRPIVQNAHEGARGDQLWHDPDLHLLSHQMQQMVAYPPEIKVPIEERKRFTLEAVGARFVEVLS